MVRTGLAALAVVLFGLTASAQESKMKFELFKGKDDLTHWRLKAPNGAILATAGQGYKAEADARNGIALLQLQKAGAEATFEVFEDAKKEHRWRFKAGNGQIVAASSEGYKAKADAEKAVEAIRTGAATAEVVNVKE
ncbi:Uncharacterized protein OS=Halorubrum aidingense JCM 13560 GN=C461_12133 PE=4 SV=1: DUF1508: DUF1508 [Gemmataceae bacterium]|nr:Uncharacterized protein OS=Halorubrum aidingense JCM 13560 GN=C461_12133 PE=4 SV=1: DUF1508: DUF1508 [Gemmataceae bacterium]VTT96649.1 Uncharacterized protein OS=Halorubrum aidingense JCM 13560 GN=C461_12133 PE=4 SV=1: DUF1508: DUF1508 [Gemmataceae bacterium]